MGAARVAPLPTQDCAYSETQSQNRTSPSPYSHLTPTVFRPYSNITQPLHTHTIVPTQRSNHQIKLYPDRIQTLPRPYSDLTRTLPKQNCACSKIQSQNRTLPKPYSDLTSAITRPYPNLTQHAHRQKCAYSKIQPQHRILPRPSSVQTLPAPY